MKISHNNHSYLSPSKLNSLTALPVSVKAIHSPPNTDNNIYTAADLNELIVSNSHTLSKYAQDDERNDNNSVLLSTTIDTTTTTSTTTTTAAPYTRYSALNDNKFNKTIHTDDSFTYFECNALIATNDSDSNHSKLIDATLTTKLLSSSPSIAIDSSRDYSPSDFSPLNRIQNPDDLLLLTQQATTSTSTTSGTSSWRRRPLLSTQNRFLSLSISPPLSRRQTMPILRGTFVSS